jgi:flagellar motility protein MotE (MotC chaperone)
LGVYGLVSIDFAENGKRKTENEEIEMDRTATQPWPGWNVLACCVFFGLLGKIAVSAVCLAPQGFFPWVGPKVSEAATPAKPEAPAENQPTPAVPRVLSLLEKERQALQTREQAVAAKEDQLRVLKREVEQRLRELNAIQQRAMEFLEEEKRMQGEQNRHLVATLEAMPPDRAGKLLEKMDDEVAAQLLRRLKGKEAGAILSLLSPDKAARLSQRLLK